MPVEYFYINLAVFSYLGIVEPILERVLKRELILEHFWVTLGNMFIGDRLTRKDLKRLLVAQYLFVTFMSVIYICMNDRYMDIDYGAQMGYWAPYLPIPFLLYFAVVEPILERVLKEELMLEHFWILPSETLTDRQLKRRWIVGYLGAAFLVAMAAFLHS